MDSIIIIFNRFFLRLNIYAKLYENLQTNQAQSLLTLISKDKDQKRFVNFIYIKCGIFGQIPMNTQKLTLEQQKLLKFEYISSNTVFSAI